MVILTFGSSTTLGEWDQKGGWADRLRDFAYQKAAATNFTNYADVYNLGIDGDNSERLIKRFENEIQARIYGEKDLIIFIAIGLNDSQYLLEEKHNWIQPEDFENNLHTLLDTARKYNSRIVFVSLTPVDNRVDPIPWKKEAAYRMEYIQSYNEIIKKICNRNKLPFIDILEKFLQTGVDKILQDGLHPTTQGHEIIFEEVKKYLVDNSLI